MTDTVAPERHLAIPNNADFRRFWKKQNEDGTFVSYEGYTPTGALRSSLDDDSVLILNLASYLSISGDDDEEIHLDIPKSVLAGLDYTSGFFDVVLESPEGEFERFLQGTMTNDRGPTA